MTFNVHRKEGSPFLPPKEFMPRHRALQDLQGGMTPQQQNKTQMRYAEPGERPPSKYAPGVVNPIGARLDAYVLGMKGQVIHRAW
jgi:hypothetical protein